MEALRKVKFADLGVTDEQAIERVVKVMRSGKFILGPECEEFAEKWAFACGAKYCIPVASGSAAIIATLRAYKYLDCAEGIMILPALSFAATAFSTRESGMQIAYCDVKPNGLLDQEKCLELISVLKEAFCGIVPVWLYGQVEPISKTLRDKCRVIVEDACQAHGAVRHLQGDAACFSFYPAKNLGSIGDAGAVVTNDEKVRDRVFAYANYGDGPGEKYRHHFQATNVRMDALHAAYLNALMDKDTLYTNNLRRRLVAETYIDAGVRSFANEVAPGLPNVYHQFPVLVNLEQRERLIGKLKERGIETGVHYPYVLPAVVSGYCSDKYPVASYISKHELSLPIGPHMGATDASYVASVLMEVAELRPDSPSGIEIWCLKKT